MSFVFYKGLLTDQRVNNFTGIDFKPLDKLNPYTITEII